MRVIPLVALLGVLALASTSIRGQSPPAPDGPPGGAQSAEADDPVYGYGDKRPGQSERLPRGWDGSPALIPHAIKGLTPITARRNACLACHGRAGATTGPPPAPPSHFVDVREGPGVTLPQVARSRWNCTACHVPQTNAPPLVGVPPRP